MARWKPTPGEAAKIRGFAGRECSVPASRLSIEAGIRYNINYPDLGSSDNIALVSLELETGWADTDLYDFRSWTDFRSDGVELTEDGRAVVDFYCTTRGLAGKLISNIQAHVEGGQLVALEGVGLPRENIY